jgi:hypothetical protein
MYFSFKTINMNRLEKLNAAKFKKMDAGQQIAFSAGSLFSLDTNTSPLTSYFTATLGKKDFQRDYDTTGPETT